MFWPDSSADNEERMRKRQISQMKHVTTKAKDIL